MLEKNAHDQNEQTIKMLCMSPTHEDYYALKKNEHYQNEQTIKMLFMSPTHVNY